MSISSSCSSSNCFSNHSRVDDGQVQNKKFVNIRPTLRSIKFTVRSVLYRYTILGKSLAIFVAVIALLKQMVSSKQWQDIPYLVL